MRILVLANTPAHVHLYRHAVDRLERAGHDVLVLTRRYACTTDLLDYFDMPYRGTAITKLSGTRNWGSHAS